MEERISSIIGRPASIGHLGEYIASRVFDIRLATNANQKGFDGWFESGPHKGKSVNIKWYSKDEGSLDMCIESGPEFYLVLVGPASSATRTLGPRPWQIESVYLFEEAIIRSLVTSKIGIATSIRREIWRRHRVYPETNPEHFSLTDAQREDLALFSGLKS